MRKARQIAIYVIFLAGITLLAGNIILSAYHHHKHNEDANDCAICLFFYTLYAVFQYIIPIFLAYSFWYLISIVPECWLSRAGFKFIKHRAPPYSSH
jgi:hypothetical protein